MDAKCIEKHVVVGRGGGNMVYQLHGFHERDACVHNYQSSLGFKNETKGFKTRF